MRKNNDLIKYMYYRIFYKSGNGKTLYGTLTYFWRVNNRKFILGPSQILDKFFGLYRQYSEYNKPSKTWTLYVIKWGAAYHGTAIW